MRRCGALPMTIGTYGRRRTRRSKESFLRNQRCVRSAGCVGSVREPGNWPDMDNCCRGAGLGPSGVGEARQSRETRDEQQTEFTLWAIARSP